MIMSMTPAIDDLRKAAKASSWSQAEIARALGLSTPHVCQFYAGTKGLTFKSAEKLAAFLGLEIIVRSKDKAKPKGKAKGKGK